MAMLHRFTLKHNKKGGWDLKDQTGEVVRSFTNKRDALSGGLFEKLLGKNGGSVRIHKQDGKLQEERTYPRASDPRRSLGSLSHPHPVAKSRSRRISAIV